MNQFKQRVGRLAASIAGVCLITFLAYRVSPVNAMTVGFAYLLFVLIVASVWGFFEATVSSILATAFLNFYFLAPIGTFTISDPQNWVAVLTLLATALIASRLSALAKRRAIDAIERQHDVERLYSFSRSILLIEGEPFAKQLAQKLAEIFDLNAVVLYDRRADEIHRAGPADFEGMEDQLREAALQGTSFQDPQRNRVITAVRLGSEPIASLALQGSLMPDSVLQSVANLVAIGLERARAQDLAHQVEAGRQTDRLRATLIDAMAHELKTPLTVIKAATTSLRANSHFPDENKMELITVADEEAEHLQELIDDYLEMARLDSAQIDLQTELTDLGATARDVVASMSTAIDSRPVDIQNDPQTPRIFFDQRLVKLAIKQLLDNALKYSPPGTPVALRIRPIDGTVSLKITDHGEGIPEQEQPRIFQRFYRSPSVHSKIPGSGLGLSIAHRIAHAHRGDLTVTSRPGETTFQMILPLGRKGEGH